MYRASDDPWNFRSSAYEQAKYQATLDALPRAVYASGFEIGCSIGVLTERLAARCRALLAVDVSEAALAQARRRLAGQPHVDVRALRVPDQFPDARFDLVLLSEVGYYWSAADLARAAARMVAALDASGTLLLVHWTPRVADYPLTGDAVHEHFLALDTPAGGLRHVAGMRRETYRLDVFERR